MSYSGITGHYSLQIAITFQFLHPCIVFPQVSPHYVASYKNSPDFRPGLTAFNSVLSLLLMVPSLRIQVVPQAALQQLSHIRHRVVLLLALRPFVLVAPRWAFPFPGLQRRLSLPSFCASKGRHLLVRVRVRRHRLRHRQRWRLCDLCSSH